MGAKGTKKCRNIDEMSESEINGTVEDYETYIPKGIECILALVAVLWSLFGKDIGLQGWTSDFKAAYRQVAVWPQHYKYCGVAWWDPKLLKVMIGILTALAFGARRAPGNWGRVVVLLMHISWHHLLLLVLDYVDDINSVEPKFSAESGRQAWIEMVSLLGFTLDLEKTSPSATQTFDSLGVSWFFNDPRGLVEILARRADNLKLEISDVLAARRLVPGHAGRLHGKLSFAVVAAFGRFGRAMLSAIKRRQYKHDASMTPNYNLTPQLEASLRWWLVRLSSLPPRGVPPSPCQQFLVGYSDGEGTGKIAASLTFLDKSTQFCCTAVPANLLERWPGVQHIHRIEACGPATCLLSWAESLRGQLLLFFIDNQSALGSLVGGWSNEHVLNDITAVTWALAADLHVFVYFEYVQSASNIIDKASRVQSPGDLAVYQQRGWQLVPPKTFWHML